jgi:hemerythrin-like domain-containing protein
MAIMDHLSNAGEKIGKALSRHADEPIDILDKLKEEHEEVDALLKQLVAEENGTKRKSLVKKIKAALVPHVRAEQKVVYDAVIALRNKEAKIDGNEGYLEHQLAEKVLKMLEKVGASTPEFAAAAKVLKELVEHHVEEEERNIWRDVRNNFSDEERQAMCSQFLAAKKKARLT